MPGRNNLMNCLMIITKWFRAIYNMAKYQFKMPYELFIKGYNNRYVAAYD